LLNGVRVVVRVDVFSFGMKVPESIFMYWSRGGFLFLELVSRSIFTPKMNLKENDYYPRIESCILKRTGKWDHLASCYILSSGDFQLPLAKSVQIRQPVVPIAGITNHAWITPVTDQLGLGKLSDCI